MPSGEIEQGFIDELLALADCEQQSEFLGAADRLNAEGLDRLLDVADGLLNDDPGKARRLAELCAAMAGKAGAPAALPRANYIRAGAHGINGQFREEMSLTKAAHDGYIVLGMDLEALRTNAGKMATLLQLGDYGEALAAGRVVLDALDGKGGLDPTPTEDQYHLLAAPVHQNRGACFELMGRYDEALDAYTSAEEHYRALGTVERVGEILDNRGGILAHLGRGGEALAAHEEAAAIFKSAGLSLSFAKALVNIGQAHLRQGNYTLSLEAFERARRLLGSLDALADEYLLLGDTADAYLELNLYHDALAAYKEASHMLKTLGMAHYRARALWGMGSALIARSEFEEAERALAKAVDLFGEANNTPLLSSVMLEQASLLDVRGDRARALSTARRALDLVSGNDWPVQLVYAHLRLSDLLMPDVKEAEPHLLEAEVLADRLALPQLRYRLNERLGHLRRLQGRDGEARVLLTAAIDEIERMRGSVAQEAMRVSFLRDKIAAYEDLMELHLTPDNGDARRAFVIAERAKSRALVDLLTGVTERGAAPAGHPEVEERIQRLQADLNASYSRMLGATSQGHSASLQDLHERASRLEAEVGRLRLQAAASSDPFATPVVAPEDILERLTSDATLLAYHAIGDEILVFVVVDKGIRVVRRLSTVASVRRLSRKLGVQWDRFRAGRGFASRHMAMLERSARQVLAALYDELVAPLESLLEAANPTIGKGTRAPKLVVVPHGPLHQVPFHALFDGERYLLERFEFSYAPSATVYAMCQEHTLHERDGAVAFGVKDPSIPAAAEEARAVAQHLSYGEVRIGRDATIEALRKEAPEHGILHLACHGLFRSDNPMFSALKLHDGWLTAADATSLDLLGTLVTLSACESGRGEVIGGDEVLGLTRAFLGAGAATLVVSLWLVHDETTEQLMVGWYERLQSGMDRSAALRAAQLALKDRYPHPYYWAPFVLIGKR